MPQPGDDTALFGVVADIMERRLDRSRPLWECWIIEGLPSDRWAILMKIHHCIADGIAAAQLLSYLSDEGTVDSFSSDIDGAKPTAPQKNRRFELTLNPVRLIRSAVDATASVGSEVIRVAEGALQIASGLLDSHPLPLRGPVTDLRRYASTQVSLADVGRICHAYDVTINDVALAAITDSFRAAMIRRGERPGARSLRTWCPCRCVRTTRPPRSTTGYRSCCRACLWTSTTRSNSSSPFIGAWRTPNAPANAKPAASSSRR